MKQRRIDRRRRPRRLPEDRAETRTTGGQRRSEYHDVVFGERA